MAGATPAKLHPTAGACTGLQVPQHACKSLRAVPGANQSLEGPENVKEMLGAQACGWRHMDCTRHPALCSWETSSSTLASPELPTSTPARVAGCKPMQRCLLLPARLACSATCRQRQCSSDARRGRQQATAMNFLLLHQPSPAFNSSQTLDPKSSAISQAAGIPRLTGRAADANKGLFFSFPFMQLLAGARLFPRRPHPESSCSLLLYAER